MKVSIFDLLEIAIIEDYQSHAHELNGLIKAEMQERNLEFRVHVFSNPADYLLQKKLLPHIIFLDIELGTENGINFAYTLRKQAQKLRIIFFTSYAHYSQDIFEVSPTSFLIKPLNKLKLKKAIDLALKELEMAEPKQLLLKKNNSYISISTDTILYMESKSRQVTFYCDDNSASVYITLNEIEKQLPPIFLRCHKSFVVNMSRILSLDSQMITLQNKATVPVSQRFRREVKQKYLSYLGELI